MRIWIAGLIGLLCLATAAVAAGPDAGKAPKPSALSGRVLQDGQPFPGGAMASIFDAEQGSPPDRGSVRRVPKGLMKVDALGNFRVEVVPGKYYLGAVARSDRGRMGPPGPDEKFFFARDKAGELRIFEVFAGQTTDTGVLSGSRPESFPEIVDAFTVEGTIYDEQGKPFGGALILVRSELKVPRPLFISGRTGEDGGYQLKLPAGGPYFLVVRDNLINVGRPAPGDVVGIYGGAKPLSTDIPNILNGGRSVSGEVGTVLKGINIVMYKIPDPEEKKTEFLKQLESPTPPGSVISRPPRP
jgi:hypothetical protein